MKIMIGLFFSALLVAAVACGTESPSNPQGGAAGTATGKSTGNPENKNTPDGGKVAPSTGASPAAAGGW